MSATAGQGQQCGCARAEGLLSLSLSFAREPTAEDLQALCRVFPAAHYRGEGQRQVSALVPATEETEALLLAWQAFGDIVGYTLLPLVAGDTLATQSKG